MEKAISDSTWRLLIRLGYPQTYIKREFPIKLNNKKTRIADIFCVYKNNTGELKPLMLIECKIKHKAEDWFQLCGYNQHIDAPIICITDKQGMFIKTKNRYLDYVPTFEQAVMLATQHHAGEDSNP